MKIQKLASTDGFLALDHPDATVSTGVVRCARKVLRDGAVALARVRTYSHAILGQQRAGASAAINAEGDARADAIAAFLDEVKPLVADHRLALDPGKGVSGTDLAPLTEIDGRGPLHLTEVDGRPLDELLLAEGVVAAVSGALGTGLAGRRVGIEGFAAGGPALAEAFARKGALVVAVSTSAGTASSGAGLDAAVLADAWATHGPALVSHVGEAAPAAAIWTAGTPDVLAVGSAVGVVDHVVAAGLTTMAGGVVVPHSPLAVTARGLAEARRGGVAVLPDFLTTSGPLFAWWPPEGVDAAAVRAEATERITAITAQSGSHPAGHVLAACERAEAFLLTWVDELPFGRPLA